MFGLGRPDRSDRPVRKKASVARRMRRRRREHSGGEAPRAAGFEAELLALHSQARPANYRLNAELCRSAQGKAEEMHRTGRMSHTNADGSPFYKRIARAGYDYTTCGENIGEDFPVAEGVFRAWMNSPAHKANIMSRRFTEIGFGHSGGYWAAHFGDR